LREKAGYRKTAFRLIAHDDVPQTRLAAQGAR
jgi:hypothetical protein